MVVLLTGWCLNLYKLVAHTDFSEPYKAEAIRIAGVFIAPAGGVIGWIDIDDTPEQDIE